MTVNKLCWLQNFPLNVSLQIKTKIQTGFSSLTYFGKYLTYFLTLCI